MAANTPDEPPATLAPIALTGATGFIGRHLAHRLTEAGTPVIAITRPGREVAFDRRVTSVEDRGDPAELARALAAHEPTAVVHLATHFVAHHQPGDVNALVDSNIGFAARVAEASVLAGCVRFVNASSAWQHVGGADYAPVSLYAATKQAFEDILRHYSDNAGLGVRTLTFFDTYGPDDTRRKLLPLLISAEATGERLEMSSGRQLIDLLHVDDVVDAIRHASSGSCPNGSWTVSSGAPLTVRRLVEVFQEVRGVELDLEFAVRPDRPNEMLTPWTIGRGLPDWSPKVDLATGLAGL